MVAINFLVDHAGHETRRDLGRVQNGLPVIAAPPKLVVDVRVPAQSIIEGQVGTKLPGVLHEKGEFVGNEKQCVVTCLACGHIEDAPFEVRFVVGKVKDVMKLILRRVKR